MLACGSLTKIGIETTNIFSSLKIFEIKKTSESDLLFEPFFPAPKYSKFTQFSILKILSKKFV